jgi:hypothetical protein
MRPLLYFLPPFLLLCTTTYALSLSNPSADTTTYRSAYDEFVFNHNPKNALALYDSLPPSPYLWQRGLAAYCAGEYLTAVEQFRFDKKVKNWPFAFRLIFSLFPSCPHAHSFTPTLSPDQWKRWGGITMGVRIFVQGGS